MKMNTRSVSPFSVMLSPLHHLSARSGCSSGSLESARPIQAAQAKNAGNFSNTVFSR
jgi:hypothetical protein